MYGRRLIISVANQFERALADAFNDHLGEEPPRGYAHRKKQHRFTSQECDVMVDSPMDEFYLAIECKSIKDDSTNKLYFSTHFSDGQLDRLKRFCDMSGRTGYVAVEVKRGAGIQRRAFLLPLETVLDYRRTEAGIPLGHMEDYTEIPRKGSEYRTSIDTVT